MLLPALLNKVLLMSTNKLWMFSWFGHLRFCLFSIRRPIDKKTQASVTPPYRKSNTASEYLLDKTATKVWCWHVVVQIRSQSRLEGPSGRHLGSSPWKSDWAHGEVPWGSCTTGGKGDTRPWAGLYDMSRHQLWSCITNHYLDQSNKHTV